MKNKVVVFYQKIQKKSVHTAFAIWTPLSNFVRLFQAQKALFNIYIRHWMLYIKSTNHANTVGIKPDRANYLN